MAHTRHVPGWGYVLTGPHLTPRHRAPEPAVQMAACEHCGEPVECYASTTYHTLGPANTLTGQSGREQFWCERCRAGGVVIVGHVVKSTCPAT